MTDNKIIKALECCIKNDTAQCKICAYDKFEQGCRRKLNPDILDLINRQQADIERLKSENKDLVKRLSDADSVKLTVEYWEQSIKSEAIKEFAERLKENTCFTDRWGKIIPISTVDNLVKEKTEVEE